MPGRGSGSPHRAENRLTGGGERGYGRDVTRPLLDRAIVRAAEFGVGGANAFERSIASRLEAAVRQYA
jgi:hypothetical protein